MAKVKNFNTWFQEDVQERLTRYKRAPEHCRLTDYVRLGHNTIEVMIRLPRERHYSWISLKNLCLTLEGRLEMEPGDLERLRAFIAAEAQPLLDARAAEFAKRQQQSEQAKQQAQDAAAYVADLEDQHVKLVELCARLTGEEERQVVADGMRKYASVQDYKIDVRGNAIEIHIAHFSTIHFFLLNGDLELYRYRHLFI